MPLRFGIAARMFRVASYNIRKAIGTDRRRRPERTIEVLCELDADIVALQEADRRFGERQSALPLHLLAEHSPYRAVTFGWRDGSLGWHGNAILVKPNVEILSCEMMHIPALEPRGAVMADLRVDGRHVRVVGMHLDLSGLRRKLQAHSILHQLAQKDGEPATVLMGDLNEWSPRSGCLREFAVHHRFADCGPSFHSRRPVGRLDRIMVNDQVDIAASGTHSTPASRKASDHLPIWADLRPR